MEIESKILIFAGTTEGRMLCEEFSKRHIHVTACVATEYGEMLIEKTEYVSVLVGRLNTEEIKEIIREDGYEIVIDATHPYASIVTNNIIDAVKGTNAIYYRVIRICDEAEDVIYFNNIEEVVAFLNENEGRAFITTGSKDIIKYSKVINACDRLTVRVLPSIEAIELCSEAGFCGKNVICMQGPFSEDLNYALIKDTDSKYLVTKQSGTYGGFLTKVSAAKRAGAVVLAVRRPVLEKGYTVREVMEQVMTHKKY